MQESRIKKSLLNAKINLIFYFLTLTLSFFSRKIFLDYLGAEFIGLTGTLQNLLGFLNLADLGIGASIGYVLYKPIYDKDEKKINEIISVLGFLYQRIGLIIAVAGIVLSLFLPYIFSDTTIGLGILYAVYYGFLISSLIGYFINYRQTLLGADQKNYIVTGYFQTANLIKIIIQMIVALYYCNFYVWIFIELSFNIAYSFILNYKIDKTYPWLESSILLGKVKYVDNKIVITKAKQMFVHVLAGIGRNQLLPFLIYVYSSLTIVAYYGNYTIITSKVQILFNQFLNSTGAGVGNLIAQGEKEKIQEVFWELQILRISIAAFIVYSLWALIDPFIVLWLGEKYIMSPIILSILLLNVFLSETRGCLEQFIYGYGLFHDVWAPIASLIITVGIGAIGGYFYGLPGVMVGDCASSLLVIHIWKPYLLFKEGFKVSIWNYWQKQFLILLITCVAFASSIPLMRMLDWNTPNSYAQWIFQAIINICVFILIYVPLLYLCFKPTRKLIKRLYLNLKY